MIEIKIIQDGEERLVKLRSPTGEEANEYFDKLETIQTDPENSTTKVKEFRTYRKELILKLDAGKSFKDMSEFDKLSIDEQEKLHSAIESKFFAFKQAFL